MTEIFLLEVDHGFSNSFIARAAVDTNDISMCSHEAGGTGSVFFDLIDEDGLYASYEETAWA